MKGFKTRNNELLKRGEQINELSIKLHDQSFYWRENCKVLNDDLIQWLKDELLRETGINYSVRRSFDNTNPFKKTVEFILNLTTDVYDVSVGSITLSEDQLDKEHLTREELIDEWEKKRKQKEAAEKEARYQEYLKLKEEFENDL